MAEQYDLVVVGAGTAAMVAATRVRAAGRSVAVIDERPYGGTCALRGCDPKKMLRAGAEAVDIARRMQGRGIAGDPCIDWPSLVAHKRSFTDPVPGKHQRRYADKGIATWHGHARLTGRDRVEVDGRELTFGHLLLAAGAEPARLDIPGEEYLATSDDFLNLEKLPERIVLVGGGYITAEYAHIAARAGAKVTILQRGSRMLPQFDADLVSWLMEGFEAVGIDVRTDAEVRQVELDPAGGCRVRAMTPDGPLEVRADLAIHAAGRVPALRRLDLDAGGIETSGNRLKLNGFLQSVSNPAVYAAGDMAQVGPPLTPVSSHDAKVVAANILEGNHRQPDYRGVPSVAFTFPPIAAAGLREDEARAQGLRFRLAKALTPGWFTALREAEPVYGHKVLVDEDSGRILGAHLVGPHADEVINLFALAIRHGLTADDVKATMFAYPTGASDIGSML
ncbi:dihydrolipoyl dehydrogenase family protein [Indioceanicola profundi]|uniref:dihydrolipoyl dehydrogenase family protein n=1 Tax=Indioceanicola profundi TaxID=2220096 RepID=UPI000E6AB716|nr:NAD(P)/FAD-dependent oxidoreductase [Indioceanicola profundi]